MDATSAGMIGKYQVIRVLGRGGMGEVVLAQDDLGRRVAIKRPFKSAMEDGLARFKVEARAATLSHPNIPVVYEMGTQDGLPFIAMEFVEGEPLDKLISSGTPLDLLTKLSIIEQVCAGLGHAHQKGIIHRDIKPANVILQPNGVAKIIDFGIAKIQSLDQTSGLTQTSQIIGSLHYIAPERFKGEAVDGRVDVFSAGVMLYLLLTGHLPFAGGEATASYRIVNEAHTSLATHIHDYPPALDAILDQALAKNPDDRYATAEDFADALHEVIEDLKKSRVFQLFDDAERLTTESRFAPALELLDEALKLDPANTQVRKLRKFVREHQERLKRAERLRDFISRADEALAIENYQDALAHLKDAQRLDATFPELQEKIQAVEERKRRYDKSVAALADAQSARDRGDITAALRIAERGLQEDPENSKLLAVRGALARQLETEALQGKVLTVLDSARRELAAQHFPAVEQLLGEAEAIDPSHPKIDELRRELAKVREQEERRKLLDEIHRRVNEFLRSDSYDQAADLLNRAIEKLPTETTLHRMKVEVDTGARKYDAKRLVDNAISAAKELFPTAPGEALAGLQKAIEEMPGEERLVSYERSLRQQLNSQRVQQLLGNTLRDARELISAKQLDKAIGVLESYHLEYGDQTDVDELLTFARNELAGKQRRMLVERTTAEVRSLVRDERLDDAIRLLESVLRESADATLSRLLEDIREQQVASARKLDVVQKRVGLLRERGELDEAIQVLQEYLTASPKSPRIQELLTTLTAEREQKQATNQAIVAARKSAQSLDFAAALESLQAVIRAYGDSPELTREIQQVHESRAAFAQEAVGKSIEGARAALLKNDAQGALAALKSATQLVEFADATKQGDWRRIGQAAKKAVQQPATGGASGADLLAAIAVEPAAKSRSPLIFVIVGACLVLAAVGAFVWWKMQPVPPPAPSEAHIRIAKAPPGALVSIDSGKQQPADANGELTVKVQPGPHVLVVSKDGFDPFTDQIQVGAGETFQDNVSLSKQPLAGKSGTLLMQGNLAGFKVSVDGHPRGTSLKKDWQLTLEEGSHTIKYANEDGSDVAEHTIQIAAGKNTSDSFTLKTPAPVLGTLPVQTNAGAQIVVDGQLKGRADGSGSYTIGSLPAGPHTVSIALDKFQATDRQVVTTAGTNQALVAKLQALPPEAPITGALTVQTNPGAQISIDGQGSVTADSFGRHTFENLAPRSHAVEVVQDKFQPYSQEVTVSAGPNQPLVAKLQPVPVAQEPPVAVTQKPTAVVDNGADVQLIEEARQRFVSAYESRNLGRLEGEWLNLKKQDKLAKQINQVLQAADILKVNEKCDETRLVVTGNNAVWPCYESVDLVKNHFMRPIPVTLYFVKEGTKWVLQDKH
jgi:eukaryotic-like serine/threonine-protein kinase